MAYVSRGTVKCVSEDQYSFVNSLKQFATKKNAWCKPRQLNVSQGYRHDGVVEIEIGQDNDTFGTTRAHLLTDDGRLYKNLSRLEVERFYQRILFKPPDQRVSAASARQFITWVFGPRELSKKGMKWTCATFPGICRPSARNSAYYLAARGKYRQAMCMLKGAVTAAMDSKTFEGALRKMSNILSTKQSSFLYGNSYRMAAAYLNVLAQMIALAKNDAFRKQHAKNAVRYARIALETVKGVYYKQGQFGWIKKAAFPYNRTMAMAYAANGQYQKALKHVSSYRVDGKDFAQIPRMKALRERILLQRGLHVIFKHLAEMLTNPWGYLLKLLF